MAIYTKLSENNLKEFFLKYNLGKLLNYKGIQEGIENTNYFIQTDKGKFILTVYEKRVEEKDLPFFISLMKNLFDKKFPSPEPIINKNGNYISEISEKKAAVVSFLEGSSKKILNPNDCYEVGINTAKLHLITKNLTGKRENKLSINSWRQIYNYIKKFKLSSFLVPISTAIFANSPIVENSLSGYLSYRSKVWQNTSRAGLPKIFLEDMDFEKYTDFVINMPLLFVLKDSKYLNAKGKKFKDFMDGKLSILKNVKPNIVDFKNHLATIFTEVRLKKYIEIRSLDTCEWDCHCGGPAFYAGLLYGNLDSAYEIISKWKVSDILNAYIDAPKKGLNTIINNKTILEWGKIFLNLSKKGLEKRSLKNDSGKDESIFLRSVESIINNNKTKADITIEKFKNKKDLSFLYEKT